MRYYLRYVDPIKPKSLRISPYVKGSLLHKLIEDFWQHLGTFDEVEQDKKNNKKKSKEKKKYYDPESFGEYAQGKWTQTVIRNEKMEDPKKKIFWRDGYDDNSEAWEIRAMMPKMTAALYRIIIEEGPPLYSEKALNLPNH
jgi:rubrerythrin